MTTHPMTAKPGTTPYRTTSGTTATLVEGRRTCSACSRALLPLIESGLSPEGWDDIVAWMPEPRASHSG